MRLKELAETRPLAILTVTGLVAATAAAAAPLSHPEGRALLGGAGQHAVQAAAPVREAELVRVWVGEDLDGDGRGDFVNPTGHDPRRHDAYGEGEFGATRDGGARRHEGVDYMARAGQDVVAPISGYVTKIGYAYADDGNLKFIEITNPALRIATRVFYVNPKVDVGQPVAMGHTIGTAKSLQRKYPGGMTDHVHLEVIDRRGVRIDATKIITAEYVPMTVAAAD
ncbi:MAG: peptidase M23 [Phenylobacterium zucineum]|nr:MAG: peptidase M23 [Phenylobacterium zucineum]